MIFKLIAQFLAYFSLPTIHRLGAWLGFLVHWCTPQAAQIQKENLQQSGLCKDETALKQTINANIAETGKAMLETLAIWQKSEPELLGLVKQATNWDKVEQALAGGKGIIFLTPHLGCFEITSIYYGSYHPITVLYRPPKIKALESLILTGRTRKGVSLAPANANGVRKLMQGLKKGEAIGILPDQIPAAGEGEWADFFGKPAYTMTLASKLAEKTGAPIFMVFGERLSNGQGFIVHFEPVDSINTPTLLNAAIETQVAQKPAQYLWRYNRYKVRRHSQKNTPS